MVADTDTTNDPTATQAAGEWGEGERGEGNLGRGGIDPEPTDLQQQV
jgi:hypothetical protein